MSSIASRRAAVCGGALVIAIGAGALVVPAAEASPLDIAVPVVTTTTGTLLGTSQPSASPSASAPAAPTGSTSSTSEPSAAPSSAPQASTVVADTTGTLASAVQQPTVPVVDTAVTPVATAVPVLLGGAGSGLIGVSTNDGGSSGGGIGVTVGSDGDGGSLASVQLGGGTTPIVSIGATGSSGVTGTAGIPGTDGSAGTGGTSAGTGAATAGTGGLLGLGLRRSLSTVYPAKDGYRDSVSFTLDGLTPSGSPEAVDGLAVLRRGRTVVKRWKVTRSDQVLSWNGTTGSKIVPGTYRLTAGARDAGHRAFAASTSVKVSAKRLVATTAKYSALAVSGTHAMVAAPRAGLDRGRVTVRVTTIASKVKGKQKLIFERNGKRIVVPITRGTRTTKAITVPASFTRYTIRHTWKKGQVKLKAIRYVYSYQSLR